MRNVYRTTIYAFIGLSLSALAFAAEDPIVRNVFTPGNEISIESLQLRKAELDAEYTALQNLEKSYIESYRALSKGTTPDDIVGRLNSFVGSLTQAEREGLASGTIPEMRRAEWEILNAKLAEWFSGQKSHHALIDRLNLEKFNFFIKQSRYYSDSLFLELVQSGESGLSMAEKFRITAAHEKIVVHHAEFLKHLDKYGTPKDVFRLAAIRDVFSATKDYYELIRRLSATPGQRFARVGRLLSSLPKRLWENIKLIGLLPDALTLGRDILFNGGGPVNQTVNQAFLKAARMKGYAVKIKDRRNLKIATQNTDPKTVNIIAKVHRGPVLDNMVLAELGLPDYAFVTSFGSVIPEFYADRLKDNPGIAFVGPGFPNGIETVTDKTIKNPARIMVNYAEGSIGNMGETRPIAQKFSTAIIPEFWKKGYKVNLIPVTSQAASFLKKDISSKLLFGKIIEARVHQPLSNDAILFLQASGKLEDLGILIRSVWLTELMTDIDQGGTLIEGSLSIRGMEKMLFKYFNIQVRETNYCPMYLMKQ